MAKDKLKKETTLAAEPKTLRLDKDRKAKNIGEIPLKTYEMKRNAFVGIKK